MRKIYLLLAGLNVSIIGIAQQVRPANSAQIYSEICRLNHLAKVLYVAAHPDDENTRLLAWLVNYKHIQTGYLSLTRGDGGQNILGSEQGEALGLIRTHELMEARKIDGAEQYFTSAVDFGFSKSAAETFKHWYKDDIVYDAAYVMRRFRPDVIICRFPPDARAGHGHHAASAIIAEAAYKLANNGRYLITMYIGPYKHAAYVDTSSADDGLGRLRLSQPCDTKRILFNAFRFGSFNTTSESMFKLKVGQYMPGFGMGAGEMAGISRSVHKSQGAGTPQTPGIQTEYFQLVDGDSLSNSLFDGIDISWGRVDRKDIGSDIKEVLNNYDFNHPDASIPALLGIRKKISEVKDDFWRTEKLEEIDKIISDCSGLLVEVYTKQAQTVAGTTLPFTFHVITRSETPIHLTSINWLGTDTTMNLKINGDTLFTFEHKISIPANTPITQPYWLAEPSNDPSVYAMPNDTLIGLPETPNNLNATLTLKISDELFEIKVPLSYKKLDPVKGDVVEQLRIVPDVTLGFSNNVLVAEANGTLSADVRIHANKKMDNVILAIADGNLQKTKPVYSIDNISLKAGTDTIITVQLKLSDFVNPYIAYIKQNSEYYSKTEHIIQYPHLPTLQYFTDAKAKVLKKDWKCTAKKIGYIEGAGDMVADILRQTGLQVDILKQQDITNTNKLKQYDAIVTGVRAINVEKRMLQWMPLLLKYVQNGGTLIMQYNNLQDLSTTNIGPYPFTLVNERVTEEDAKVNFLHPDHRLLNYPNKITEEDFKNWVQERGLYFTSKWDERYTPLFEMNDAGEKPLQGSTLYTKYGKGNYIYTSLSFFRQLPAGNEGAIRLMMNMLSVGK
jgi:LmbE family N-acetylglucosaminyl deacetylase